MSSPGLEEHSSLNHEPQQGSKQGQKGLRTSGWPARLTNSVSTQTTGVSPESSSVAAHSSPFPSLPLTFSPSLSVVRGLPRIHFVDLAEQLRTERYLNNRREFLEGRKRILQKVIALSARLHRNGVFIRDGLVEILRSEDATCFKRVHQHVQNLVDVCYSRWNMELHALDTLDVTDSLPAGPVQPSSFLTKLSASSQKEMLSLITLLRSDSKYLITRLTALSYTQIAALSTAPTWTPVSEIVLKSLQSDAHDSQRQRVLSNNAKRFEAHSLSFERANPLSFLLFNIYGTEQTSDGPENQLRISTWSTVLADLATSHNDAYQVLIPLLLRSFASLHEWRVKESVELFLMDILQTGAFLLDTTGRVRGSRRKAVMSPRTPQADAFFENAMVNLFAILASCDWGFPHGALQFVCALMGKLPTQELQMKLRSYFLLEWYLENFLASTIVYPENENMLLDFHISENARQCILVPLHRKIWDVVYEVFNPFPSQPVHPQIRYCVECMTGALDAVMVNDPYVAMEPSSQVTSATSSIVVCAAEVVRVLEALSPQVMHGPPSNEPFMTSLTSAFHAQHYRFTDRFDRLKRELYYVLEPGSSQTDMHPCDEQWLELQIDRQGRLTQRTAAESAKRSDDLNDCSLDPAQKGALRLCEEYIATNSISEGSTSHWPDVSNHCSLIELFQEAATRSIACRDPLSQMFWEEATECLDEKYPLSQLVGNDTAVLRALVARSKIAQSNLVAACARLEADTGTLEDVSSKVRNVVNASLGRFEALKIKLWYSTDVIHSKAYEDAKNITAALNNMVTPALKVTNSSRESIYSFERPRSSHSMASSAFQQSLEDTLGMLKASPDRGGPRKLADDQIEQTRKWLQESEIDNFCRGEERIHRFCMEISITAKSLVSESPEFSASPVLWHSSLFAHERSYYDTYAFGITSAPASTRPASVVSDTYIGSLRPPISIARSVQSSRTNGTEDRRSSGRRIPLYSFGSSKVDRESQRPGSASLIGSPGKASATTAESISTFWSPLPSNAKSMTSASNYSRPASTYNDTGLNRFLETSSESTKFLNKIRHKVICLLLSDLGRTVWSMGSETDAWLNSSRDTAIVTHRLRQKMMEDQLTGQSQQITSHQKGDLPILRRSLSMSRSDTSRERLASAMGTGQSRTEESNELFELSPDRHILALEVLLGKLKAYVDPMRKLQVIEDFHAISVAQIGRSGEYNKKGNVTRSSASLPLRRNSLDDPVSQRYKLEKQHGRNSDSATAIQPTEHEIIAQLKRDLSLLRSETLFRDLQYIAAFVPTALTEKTRRSTAFFQLGWAALHYKDDVCQSLVDVAGTLVAKDLIKRPSNVDTPESTILKAAEHWMLAAREGNRIGQRELAMLYLSYPLAVPIMTLPLATTGDIFRDDMQWVPSTDTDSSTASLCLALHWMKLAASNGDTFARQKLEERQAHISLL